MILSSLDYVITQVHRWSEAAVSPAAAAEGAEGVESHGLLWWGPSEQRGGPAGGPGHRAAAAPAPQVWRPRKDPSGRPEGKDQGSHSYRYWPLYILSTSLQSLCSRKSALHAPNSSSTPHPQDREQVHRPNKVGISELIPAFFFQPWHCVLFGFSDLLTLSCFFSHFPLVHLPLLISSLIFFKHLFYPGDWGWPLSPIYLPLLQAASETPGRQWITDCRSLRWQVSWGRWRVGPRGAQDTGWWSGGDSYHSQPGPRAVFFPLPLLPHRNSSSLLSPYYVTCSLSSTQFKIVTGTPGVRYYQCTLYL